MKVHVNGAKYLYVKIALKLAFFFKLLLHSQ